MKLTVAVKLQPTPEQATLLRDTLEQANAACNVISTVAWEQQAFGQFKLHGLVYHDLRAATGLTAQVVVRAIGKVVDAYKRDMRIERTFRLHGAFPFDDRIVRWQEGTVSIWTVGGRQKNVPFVCDERTRALLANRQGESDLVYRDGKFFLYPTVNVEESPLNEPGDFLGVDLGIVNLAVTSDGETFAGATLNGVRIRHERLHKRLQRKRTNSTKRLLRKRRRKQSRMQRDTNHCIAKRLVAVAQGTGRGIALEDLTGIRDRVSAAKRQRCPEGARHGNWGFSHLRHCVSYKAALSGVPVVFIDPRNTSRTCPVCGLVDKANRVNQSRFLCQACGHSGLADLVAAENIRRAAVNLPYAGASLATCKLPDASGSR